jgi:MFS superfamily sulfate permease-like transporter
MLDIGFAELLIFVVPMWALAALVVYWVVRLAVRHGTLDAYRLDRTDRRIAEMQAAVRRQEAASGEDRA